MSVLQFKSTIKGQQLKSVDNEIFWLSPARDIIYNFIPFCHKAFAYMENKKNPVIVDYYARGGTDEELSAFAKAMVAFVKETKVPQEGDKVQQAVNRSGIMDFPPRVHGLFGYAYTMVTISHYYNSLTTSQNGEINTEAFLNVEYIEYNVKPSWKSWKGIKAWFKQKFTKVAPSSPTPSLPSSTESPQLESDSKTS